MKSTHLKSFLRLLVIGLVLGSLLTIRAMDRAPEESTATAEYDYFIAIQKACESSNYGDVQRLVRELLGVPGKAIDVAHWLTNNALLKGDPVLLYEITRLSLSPGCVNQEALSLGVRAALLLLIRVAQDIAALKEIFTDYVDNGLLMRLYQKMEVLINEAHIPQSGLEALQFNVFSDELRSWFAEHGTCQQYSNPAAIEYWRTAWARLLGQVPGIIFVNANQDRVLACCHASNQIKINAIRETVAAERISAIVSYGDWKTFFEQEKLLLTDHK